MGETNSTFCLKKCHIPRRGLNEPGLELFQQGTINCAETAGSITDLLLQYIISVTLLTVLYDCVRCNVLVCDPRSIRFKGNDVISRQTTGTNGKAKPRLHLGRLAPKEQQPRNAYAAK